jgi:hypothetical protein
MNFNETKFNFARDDNVAKNNEISRRNSEVLP